MASEGEENHTFACRVHGPLPLSAFPPSCLRKNQHMCRDCIARRNADYYRSDKHHLGALRRAQGKARQRQSCVDLLRALLEQHGLSGGNAEGGGRSAVISRLVDNMLLGGGAEVEDDLQIRVQSNAKCKVDDQLAGGAGDSPLRVLLS